jgi:dCMP deaminase
VIRKLVYISCPMGLGDRLHNISQADAAHAKLMAAGYSVINPVLNFWVGNACRRPGETQVFAYAGHNAGSGFEHFTHADWLSCDKAQVAKCDAVLRLPGESKGADEETAFAAQLRIPVFTSIDALRTHFEVDPYTDPASRPAGWWDLYFLRLAEVVATASKDPSTRVGAVIADGKRFVSAGYNGFSRGCDDDPVIYADREQKYSRVVHGEVNAILFAGRRLDGCTLYTVPFQPCDRCAGIVIQSGIRRVVAPACPPDLRERWAKSLDSAERQFREAGVKLDLIG